MSVFNIDFDKLNLELPPTFLRQMILFAFLRAETVPAERVWNEFLRNQEKVFSLLKYDSSKRNVELALRKEFDNDGIYIGNAEAKEGLHLDFYLENYLEEAGYEKQIKTAYLDEFLGFYLDEQLPTDDLTIYVPETVYLANAQAVFDFAGYFILPGFKYSVQRY